MMQYISTKRLCAWFGLLYTVDTEIGLGTPLSDCLSERPLERLGLQRGTFFTIYGIPREPT